LSNPFQTVKSQSEAGSVWDDDDEAFLLCAEASDPSFKTEKPSQKRVPKIPTYPPNLLPPKKAKLDAFQSGKVEDPFPDDDALFCDIYSPQIKKEISTSQLVSQKKLQRIKIEPKLEPVSQVKVSDNVDTTVDTCCSKLVQNRF